MIRSLPMIVAIFMLLLSNSLSAQIFIDSTGSNGFGDLPHPLAKSRFSNVDHEYNLFVRTTGQDTTRGVGIYNYMSAGTSEKYGIWNHIEQSAGALGLTYGVRNVVSHGGDMDAYGMYTDLSNTADSKGRLFGTYSLLDDQGARAQNKMYANFYGETVHRRKKNAYGSYLLVRSLSQDVTKNSYGQYIDIKGGGNAMRYGIYSNINGGSGYAGYFVGDVHINGTLTQASDEKLKKNVKEISNALEIVNQLTPHTYNYRAGDEMGFGDDQRLHYGFVAQEVAKVLPDLVTEVHHPYTFHSEEVASGERVDELGIPMVKDQGLEKSDGGDGEARGIDIRGVRYMDVIAILVGAVQEQSDIIESQSNELKELEDGYAKLKVELNDIRILAQDLKSCLPCEMSDKENNVDAESGEVFQIFPNPTSNYFVIEKPTTAPEQVEVRVITVDGQEMIIQKMNAGTLQLTTTNWPSGIYIVEVLDVLQNRLITSKQLIIKR